MCLKLVYVCLQTVYSVITYAGYIGVMTGQRPGAFTITVDERGEYQNLLCMSVVMETSLTYTPEPSV